MKAVAIISGGMDCVTLAYYLRSEGYVLHVLSFDYGQRHRKELEFALAVESSGTCSKRAHAARLIAGLT